MNTVLKHAWFSETAADRFGTWIYLREDGSKVELSAVTDDAEGVGYMWADKEYRGLVLENEIQGIGRIGSYPHPPKKEITFKEDLILLKKQFKLFPQ